MVQQRVPIPLFVLVLFLVVPALGQSKAQPQPPSRPVDGAGIFRTNCATCHGPEAHGDGPAAKALKRAVPDLTRLSQRSDGKFPAVHVRNTILFGNDDLLPAHGSKGMPIWGPIFHEIEFDQDLGNVRVENIVKYLESIQRK
jgi:mono/diheme cytochrome c family protein